MTDFLCRTARPSDQAYVASTWASNLGKFKGTRRNASLLVDKALDHKSTRIVVACTTTDENHIIGWLAFAQVAKMFVILYAFVRLDWRQRGVARSLAEFAGLPAAELVVYTFEGPTTKALRRTALHDVQRIEPMTYLGGTT
jgi:hypothetical protein